MRCLKDQKIYYLFTGFVSFAMSLQEKEKQREAKSKIKKAISALILNFVFFAELLFFLDEKMNKSEHI